MIQLRKMLPGHTVSPLKLFFQTCSEVKYFVLLLPGWEHRAFCSIQINSEKIRLSFHTCTVLKRLQSEQLETEHDCKIN